MFGVFVCVSDEIACVHARTCVCVHVHVSDGVLHLSLHMVDRTAVRRLCAGRYSACASLLPVRLPESTRPLPLPLPSPACGSVEPRCRCAAMSPSPVGDVAAPSPAVQLWARADLADPQLALVLSLVQC